MNTNPKFKLGDRVTKTKGSQWTGRVVGTYSTPLTPEGYAVESETERGSVQIYPAAALASAPPSKGLGEGGRYWRERAEFWRSQAVALGWQEKRDADNGEAAPPSAAVGADVPQLAEQARAWELVFRTLEEVSPGWRGGKEPAMHQAAKAIRTLAQQPAAPSGEAVAHGECSALCVREQVCTGACAPIKPAAPQQPAAVDGAIAQRAAKALLECRSYIGPERPDDPDDEDSAQWWDELTELAAALDAQQQEPKP